MFENFVCFVSTDQILFSTIIMGRWIKKKCLKIAEKETKPLENLVEKKKQNKVSEGLRSSFNTLKYLSNKFLCKIIYSAFLHI